MQNKKGAFQKQNKVWRGNEEKIFLNKRHNYVNNMQFIISDTVKMMTQSDCARGHCPFNYLALMQKPPCRNNKLLTL